MFRFPQNLYTDVRIEKLFETKIIHTINKLNEVRTSNSNGVFIRIFDGQRWYYSITTDLERIQEEIDILASMAIPNSSIYKHPLIERFEINKKKYLLFSKNKDILKVSLNRKLELISSYINCKNNYPLDAFIIRYLDRKKEKSFFSSKGTSLVYDTQQCGLNIDIKISNQKNRFSENYNIAGTYIDELYDKHDRLEEFIQKCVYFAQHYKHITPDKYTIILSPKVSGVFAHECIGHMSESDILIDNKLLEEEWAIGKKIAPSFISIIDNGKELASGYMPFDDDGSRAKKTFLIRNGILNSRLHSVYTANHYGDSLTGNSIALDFEYEPIVRMTNTYIEKGSVPKEDLFNEVKKGIYIETVKYGSGLFNFRLVPNLAYIIENGELKSPVSISAVTGNNLEILSKIDGISSEFKLYSSVYTGCGKAEQYPLPVGLGGPYIRINDVQVL